MLTLLPSSLGDDDDEDDDDDSDDSSDDDDDDAPWPNSYLIYSWGADDASGDSSDSKRSVGPLEERDVSKALDLYCVDCGVSGEVTASGSLVGSLFDGVESLEVSLSGNLQAGLFLGLDMFIEYQNSYEKPLINEPLTGWDIPLIISFGPYVTLGVSAGKPRFLGLSSHSLTVSRRRRKG